MSEPSLLGPWICGWPLLDSSDLGEGSDGCLYGCGRLLVRGSLLGRWDAGGSDVIERGCGRDGGETELVDVEEGSVGVLNVGVGNAGVVEDSWVCLGQLLLKALGPWAWEPLTLKEKEANAFSPLRSRLSGDRVDSVVALRVGIAGLLGPLRTVLLSPPTAVSFLCWKFLGLRPRTTMAVDLASAIGTLLPLDSVATSFSLATKCC